MHGCASPVLWACISGRLVQDIRCTQGDGLAHSFSAKVRAVLFSYLCYAWSCVGKHAGTMPARVLPTKVALMTTVCLCQGMAFVA